MLFILGDIQQICTNISSDGVKTGKLKSIALISIKLGTASEIGCSFDF